jgi:hypothetical protein
MDMYAHVYIIVCYMDTQLMRHSPGLCRTAGVASGQAVPRVAAIGGSGWNVEEVAEELMDVSLNTDHRIKP